MSLHCRVRDAHARIDRGRESARKRMRALCKRERDVCVDRSIVDDTSKYTYISRARIEMTHTCKHTNKRILHKSLHRNSALLLGKAGGNPAKIVRKDSGYG